MDDTNLLRDILLTTGLGQQMLDIMTFFFVKLLNHF